MGKAAVDLQAEIADDEGAARAVHGVRDSVMGYLDEVGMQAALAAQQARQHLRGARSSVESDGGHLFPRHLAHQNHRAHGSTAGHRDAGHHAQFFSRGRVAGNGHEPQVGLARGHRGRAA